MFNHTQPSLAPETVSVTVRPARITDLPGLVELLCQLFSIETDFEVRPARHARGTTRAACACFWAPPDVAAPTSWWPKG